MQKNTAGQKWTVFAFDRTDNAPKTGDAAQITAKISIDDGTPVAITDTNPTEVEDGYYVFDLTQAETNGNKLLILPQSSTSDVQVIGVPGVDYTQPTNFSNLSINTSGHINRVVLTDTCTTNTDMRGTDGAITSLTGIATATNISDLQTHGDSNWATATGFSTLTAQNVWEYEYRTITGAVDANVVQLSSSTTAATKLAISAGLIYTGTIEAGTTNSILVTDLSPSTDNVFEGKPLIMATGTLKAKVGAITAYNGTTKTLTVEGFEVAPNIGDTFIIL